MFTTSSAQAWTLQMPRRTASRPDNSLPQ
jgi:hypothetical protein